jgi:hypothetical protein
MDYERPLAEAGVIQWLYRFRPPPRGAGDEGLAKPPHHDHDQGQALPLVGARAPGVSASRQFPSKELTRTSHGFPCSPLR